METSKKNKPGTLVIVAISVIALLIIFYAIISMFFPDLFQNLSTGAVKPVNN